MYHLIKDKKRYLPQESKKDFAVKLDNLRICHHNDINTVVFITKDIYDESERYRVENLLEVIENIDDWYGLSIEVRNLHIIRNYLETIDIIIWSRTLYSAEYESFIDLCHKHNIMTIFSIDDYVFDVKIKDIIMKSVNNFQDSFWDNLLSSHYRMGKLCKGYLTTNAFLARKMRDVFDGHVWIQPNFLNQAQIEVSQKYLQTKCRQDFQAPFCIGYFSGTPTHGQDFMIVAEALKQLLDSHTDTIVKIVGYMEMPEILEKHFTNGRIYRLPFMDCCSLQKEIAEVDVNIVPLLENDFTNSKSEIKYFEAAIVGTLSCMTPTFVYKRLQEQGRIGYYCNANEWSLMLEYLYQQRTDLKDNFKMLSNESYEAYAPIKQSNRLRSMLNEMRGTI